MAFTYRFKLILIITSLSVILTSVCMILYYRYTYNIVMDSLSKNLKDSAQLMRIYFDESDIDRIKRLREQLEPYIRYNDDELGQMAGGAIVNNIPKNIMDRLQASDDFQTLAKKLGRIVVATWHNNADHELTCDASNLHEYFASGAMAPYIVIISDKYQDKQIVQNLVSDAYKPYKDWPGNPIGSSWVTTIDIPTAKKYPTYVADQIVSDEYYTSLYSTTALFDKSGKVVAFLEVDYPAGKQLDKLKHVRMLSYILITMSFILGLILSVLISKRMSASLKKLSDAANQIKENNYDVTVDISNNDEFGVLGNVFNQMAGAVKKTTTDLTESNERLMSLTADMHDGVGAIWTSIVIATREGSETDTRSLNNLANQGMDEIRFLMDAMEYKHCDMELLKEGVALLAMDILQPNGVEWTADSEDTPNREIPFKMYLDIQRIARESFTNIIKHSDAAKCFINLYVKDNYICLRIKDNGQPLEKPLTPSGGKGLNNIRHRVQRYGGDFSFEQNENGSELAISIKLTSE